MSRRIGKGRQVKFVKTMQKYLHEVGAELTDEWFGHGSLTGYKLNTKAGILYIGLEKPTNEHSCFSVFARFESAYKAKELISSEYRLNKYSGKWNYHYSNEDHLFHIFQVELEPLLKKRPITKWDDLVVNKQYHGETFQNRASVDMGNEGWGRPKHIKVICIDGCACFIKKSTPFQFWKRVY